MHYDHFVLKWTAEVKFGVRTKLCF